jgi:hypothetical protein
MLRLVFRALAQSQFSRPRDMDRSLRFFFLFACFLNIGPILRHVFFPGIYESRGLLLDFVGRGERSSLFPKCSDHISHSNRIATPVTRLQVIFIDVAIFVLQVITLVIAFEIGHADPDGPDALAYVSSNAEPISSPSSVDGAHSGQSSQQDCNFMFTESIAPEKYDYHTPILHLRLRPTIKRILNPPPASRDGDLPMPNTSSLPSRSRTRSSQSTRNPDLSGMGESTIGRIWSTVQRNVGEMQVTHSNSNTQPTAGDGTTGRTTEGRVPGSMPPAG